MATHSSILPWEIPWTEKPGGLWSMGWQRVDHNSTHTHRLQRRAGSEKGANILAGLAGKAFQKACKKMGAPWGSHTEKKWKNNSPPIRARKMHEGDWNTFISPLFSAILCAVEFAPCHVFSKTFKIKQFLAKKQKQDHLIPQWIFMKTGNKIRYGFKRRRIKLSLWGVPHMSTWSGTHIYAVSRSLASHYITLRTSLLSEQLDVFYWKNNLSLCQCFYSSALAQ